MTFINLEKGIDLPTNKKHKLLLKPRIPIILVPGILGSRLNSKNHPKGVWDSDNIKTMLLSHVLSTSKHQRSIFRDVGIDVMTDKNGYGEKEWKKGWGEMIKDPGYKSFLEICQNHTFKDFEPRVYAIGYNWTRSNQMSCDRIISKTMDILDNEKWMGREPKGFVFVAHSMGSLAVRAALKKSFVLRAKCLGVIFAGGPNQGGVLFYNRFFSGVTNEDCKIQLVMGREDPRVWTNIASSLQGAFELLPNNDFAGLGQNKKEWLQWKGEIIWLNDVSQADKDRVKADSYTQMFMNPPPAKDIFEVYRTSQYIGSILRNAEYGDIENDLINNIAKAGEFHNWLGTFMPSKYIIISGLKKHTDVGISLNRSMLVKVNPGQTVTQYSRTEHKLVRDANGDGTVPITSQQAYKDNALECIVLEGIDHLGLISTGSGIKKIIESIERLVSG